MDASSIALGMVLSQQGEGNIDHPIAFTSHTISEVEKNYTMTRREGSKMVYALQKFRHYLLGYQFKFFTDPSTLRY